MLFKRAVLDGIARGEIDLVFRNWAEPRVNKGTVMRTAIGVLEVVGIAAVQPGDLTEDDAGRAGFASLADLRREATARDGTLFRIELRRVGDDPRIGLRETLPDADELADLRARIGRMGAWAVPTLELIEASPGVRAPDLAATMHREKHPFKASVRRLKELGLTESLRVGYRISPRGQALLDDLRGRPKGRTKRR